MCTLSKIRPIFYLSFVYKGQVSLNCWSGFLIRMRQRRKIFCSCSVVHNSSKQRVILRDTRWDWAESGLCEFWNILLSRSCRNENIVLLPSDYKSKVFKLSADINSCRLTWILSRTLVILCHRSSQSQYTAFLRFFEQGQGIWPEIRRKHA